MQQGDQLRRPQPRQRRLELQRLVHRLVDELLDDRLAPRAERMTAEAAPEPFHARDADAVQFTSIAVEDRQAGGGQHVSHLRRLAGLEIVIAKHRRGRNPQSAQLARQHRGLLRQTVVGQIAGDDGDVRRVADLREQGLKRAL